MNPANTVDSTSPHAKPLRRSPVRRAPQGLVALGVAITALVLLPLAYLLVRAADASPLARELLWQPRTLAIAAHSLALTAAVTVASILLAVPLAWLIVRTDLPGRRLWTIALVLPLVIPSYIGAFTLLAMFGPKGVLQSLLAPLGVERLPEIYGFPGAWLTLTLFSYPYVLLTVAAAWRRMDASLEEAAASLGYSPWHTFWRVTVPLLRPAIAAGGLLVALYTLSDFGAVSLLRFNAFTQAIFTQYRASFDRSLAALLALQLVLITLVLLWAEQRARGRGRINRVGGTSSRSPRTVRLGRWRWPALVFAGLVVLLSLIVPLGVMLDWLLAGLRSGETWRPLWHATFNSLGVAGLAALVIVLAALPIAVLAVRYPSRLSTWLERGSTVGYGLPGVVVGLSLVFFGARYVPALYQTLPLLIFAYAVRFLPQSLGSTRSSLLLVSPQLHDAAHGLGLSPARAWLRVTLPLVRPGLLAGAALVFLTTLKELPITLMLAPTGFTTLATEIWSATAEAFYARAALPALLLVSVSSLSIGLLLSQERDHA